MTYTSNSESATFNTCERKWWYGFAMGVRPKKHTEALSYGILGHKALEIYYNALKEGNPWHEAYMAAYTEVMSYKDEPMAELFGDEADIAYIVATRFSRYVDRYKGDTFKILEVEAMHEAPLFENMNFAMTLDLLVEMTSGPYRGEVVLVDHKWCYNFWTQLEIDLHPQMPLYIKVLRDDGYPVKRAMLNQIRYRSLKEDFPPAEQILNRHITTPTEAAIERSWHEQRILARKIEFMTRQGVAESGKLVARSKDHTTCRYCPFNLVCKMDLYGQDSSETIRSMYEPNPYGYNH